MSARPILVTGMHRSGTTWVGKMLAASGQFAYISEPLNVNHRPGVFCASTPYWYQYICAQNEAQYLPAYQHLLKFRYHTVSELTALRSRKDFGRFLRDESIFASGRIFGKRLLLKDPFAIFSAPWFAKRLNCRIVVTIRHPAAVVSSLKRQNWRFDFADLLAQPLLLAAYFERDRQKIQALVESWNVLEQGAWLWRLIYRTVNNFRQTYPDWFFVRHEDLSLQPEDGFQALYQQMGMAFTARAGKAVRASSSGKNPAELKKEAVHAVRLDSRANLKNWKHRLTTEEIAQIRAITAPVADAFYSDHDWH